MSWTPQSPEFQHTVVLRIWAPFVGSMQDCRTLPLWWHDIPSMNLNERDCGYIPRLFMVKSSTFSTRIQVLTMIIRASSCLKNVHHLSRSCALCFAVHQLGTQLGERPLRRKLRNSSWAVSLSTTAIVATARCSPPCFVAIFAMSDTGG